MDLYITEKSDSTREIRIPWAPDNIEISSGGARFASYDILQLGEVKIPSGKNLRKYKWTGTFPGQEHSALPFLKGAWQDPKTYQNLFEEWREKGTALRLLITGTPINQDVYLSDYTVSYSGGYGDCGYTVEFCDKREIVVSSVTSSGTGTASKPEVERPSKTQTEKTHRVVSGDCLWNIALKYYGSGLKHTVLYNANKEIIEQTAKKRGLKSSNQGHWIFPGTILKIP